MNTGSNSSQSERRKNDSLGLPAQNRIPRKKVSLAPGHSPLDWAALNTRTPHFKLRGVKAGTPPAMLVRVTRDELKCHSKRDDCWISLNGRVFNVTSYIDYHPGGVDEIMKSAGRDGTALFNKYHSWVNPERLLENCWVGILI